MDVGLGAKVQSGLQRLLRIVATQRIMRIANDQALYRNRSRRQGCFVVMDAPNTEEVVEWYLHYDGYGIIVNCNGKIKSRPVRCSDENPIAGIAYFINQGIQCETTTSTQNNMGLVNFEPRIEVGIGEVGDEASDSRAASNALTVGQVLARHGR